MKRLVAIALIGLLLLVPADVELVHAQELMKETVGDCTVTTRTDPPRRVFRCPGFTFEVEAGADATVAEGAGTTDTPNAVRQEGGAILFDSGGKRVPFTVRTPHAIASVRGTTFAVEVTPESTAVLVVEGFVTVTRLADGVSETLGAGLGADVSTRSGTTLESGALPFVPRQPADPLSPLDGHAWPERRTNALLARFGR